MQAERWQDGFTITTAPLYYDGLVITGFAGGERGIRGRVKAFDAKNGKLVWTFYTIPGPGEVGHDTWPQDNELWKYGGASVWQTPAVDPELGLIYFSTGNPGPDFNGGVRTGDNLFTASIVALDAKTGKYRWHFQQVHHDIWDYDAPNPRRAVRPRRSTGTLRKGIAQPSKTGWVYILDRTTGKPLIGIDEQPVPQEPRQATARDAAVSARRRVRAAVDRHRARRLDAREQRHASSRRSGQTPVLVKPATAGGANWPPSSYDPQTGHLYVCAATAPCPTSRRTLETQRPPEGAATWRRLRPHPASAAARRVRGARHAHEQARVAAAVGGAVLQRRRGDGRRARVRRPQRRPAHGARLEQRQASSGSSRPAPA